MTIDAASVARHMVRGALKGALATRDAETGAPYASMALLATAADGAPLTLISTLARHTRNLIADPAASLLIDTSNAAGDAASGGRVSLMGRLDRNDSADTRSRFLARHPAAAGYADFADFSFWRMDVAAAHLIEGFGRIVPLAGAAMRPAHGGLARFATVDAEYLPALRLQCPEVTGFDSEGVDLVIARAGVRLAFSATALTAESARDAAANCLVAYCSAQQKSIVTGSDRT